jgi:integrase
VFLSGARNGRRSRQTPDNVGRRLKTAIRDANKRLTELGIEPISDRVSPHSLRRTYASLRAASGDDPVYIPEQLGHEDPTFTLTVYAKAVKRRERLSDEYREAVDRALEWAEIGRIDAEAPERVEGVGRAEAANPAP